ncbi:hypothetical protein FGE12_14120 [Aggregicoccus sp. 17bor-14]|uniref:hypothetical protein n=1 Tax=Myxococcaceae TaxID=31 RepID=UPI00129C39C6|nr:MULTISPECIES: hypothetical protein [Myxococcaceae]MBF5043531.1 hypothetical protein [Simulacricoccus sp. 17bor-14]MRI89288.1 hypothetical protein [Aggregicoccus sp. 17bor-14]
MARTHSRISFALTLSLGLCALPALAQAPAAPVSKPSPEAVKSTWDYFYKAQGQGPLLVDLKLCSEVAKEGPNRFECTQEVAPDAVKAGSTVMVWQSYLVPQGDSVEDLMVQVKQGTTVRETKDLKLKGEGWRARQWVGVRFPKPGSWSVTVLRGDQVLRTLDVKVQ